MTSNNNFSTTSEVKCYKAFEARGKMEPSTVTRRALQPDDVAISIKYAGICHSDIHHVMGEWSSTVFPIVPGHEIVGEVVGVGSNVKSFQIGERAGVGCMVDSCRSCNACTRGDEQYCATGAIMTYNSLNKYPHCAEHNKDGGNRTYGGYSELIIVDHRFVLHVPEKIPFHSAAPLLCAGITMYSPMKHFGLQKHHKFAVVGLGGLGHMGVKLAVAMGCFTAVISRGTSKKENALQGLKANAFIDSTNAEEMKANAGKFDFIISTVSADYDLDPVLKLLATDGKLVFVGVAPSPFPITAGSLIFRRVSVAGSLIGGVKQTQEMLDFCAEHGVTSDVEVITGDKLQEAFERTLKSDVKYRFVIDIGASTF